MTMETFMELYMNQFASTLGQLSAMMVSSSIAVPMYNYYMSRQNVKSHSE